MAFNDAFSAIGIGLMISLVAIMLTKAVPANAEAAPAH